MLNTCNTTHYETHILFWHDWQVKKQHLASQEVAFDSPRSSECRCKKLCFAAWHAYDSSAVSYFYAHLGAFFVTKTAKKADSKSRSGGIIRCESHFSIENSDKFFPSDSCHIRHCFDYADKTDVILRTHPEASWPSLPNWHLLFPASLSNIHHICVSTEVRT